MLVTVPQVGDIEFPDGMSDADIDRAIREDIYPQYGVEIEQPGLGSALSAGVDILQGGLYSTVEGVGETTGLKSLADWGKEGAERNKEEAGAALPNSQDFESAESAAEYWRWFQHTLGTSIPISAPLVAGGALGAKLGAAAGPLGIVGGTLLGAGIGAAVGTPIYYGLNRERQKEEHGRVIDEGTAFAVAPLQGALDAMLGRVLPTGASRYLALNILYKLGIGAVTEAPTELAQTVAERWQAKLPLDDENAMKEYIEAVAGGAVVGGAVSGAAGAFTRTSPATDATPDVREPVISQTPVEVATGEGLGGGAPPPSDEVALSTIISATQQPLEAFAESDLQRRTSQAVDRVSTDATSDTDRSALRAIAEASKAEPLSDPASLEVDPVQAASAPTLPVIEELAAEKNLRIKTPRGSFTERFKAFAERKVGSRNIGALTAGERAALYNEIDALPELEEQAELPFVSMPSYAVESYRRAEEFAINNGSIKEADIQKVGAVPDEEGKLVPLEPKVAKEILKDLTENRAIRRVGNRNLLRGALRRTIPDPAQEAAPEAEQLDLPLGPTVGDQLTLDLQEEAAAAPVEEVVPPAPAQPEGARSSRGPTIVPDATAPRIMETIEPALQEQAKQRGLPQLGVKSKLVQNIREAFGDPTIPKDLEGISQPATESTPKTIAVAYDAVPEGATDEEIIQFLSGVLDHETIHALIDAGVITNAQWKQLYRYAQNNKEPGTTDTYFRNAQTNPAIANDAAGYVAELGLTGREAQDAFNAYIGEEAVAQAFRAFAADPMSVSPPVRNMFRKIIDTLKGLVAALRSEGFQSAEEIFRQIASGELVEQAQAEGRVAEAKGRAAEGEARYSRHNAEAENAMRTSMGRVHPGRRYSVIRTDNAGFHSALIARAESLQAGSKLEPRAWKKYLSEGTKKEEREWSGIMDWLDAREKWASQSSQNPKSISQEEVINYLENHEQRLDEVVFSDENYKPDEEVADTIPRRDYVNFHKDFIKQDIAVEEYDGAYRLHSIGYPLEPDDLSDPSLSWLGKKLPTFKTEKEGLKFLNDTARADAAKKTTEELRDTFEEALRDDYGPAYALLDTYRGGYGQGVPEYVEDYTFTGFKKNSNREIVITWPEPQESDFRDPDGTVDYYAFNEASRRRAAIGGSFTTEHWPMANPVVHMRINERVGPKGERVLFIEEIQSDWHQEGASEGYLSFAGYDIRENSDGLWEAHDGNGEKLDIGEYGDAMEATMALHAEIETLTEDSSSAPDAPWKKSWIDLGLKRLMRWAVDNNYDNIAWTSGQQQIDRYGIQTHVKKIHAIGKNKTATLHADDGNYIGTISWRKGDRQIISAQGALPNNTKGRKLDELLGEDIAKKLLALPVSKTSPLRINDVNIEIGGKIHKLIYDKLIPQFFGSVDRNAQKAPMTWETKAHEIGDPNPTRGLKKQTFDGIKISEKIKEKSKAPSRYSRKVRKAKEGLPARDKRFAGPAKKMRRYEITLQRPGKKNLIRYMYAESPNDARGKIYNNATAMRGVSEILSVRDASRPAGRLKRYSRERASLNELRAARSAEYEDGFTHSELARTLLLNPNGKGEFGKGGIPDVARGGDWLYGEGTKEDPYTGILKSLPGVRADEIRELGLDDFLRKNADEPITREAIANFVMKYNVPLIETRSVAHEGMESYRLHGGDNYRELVYSFPDRFQDNLLGVRKPTQKDAENLADVMLGNQIMDDMRNEAKEAFIQRERNAHPVDPEHPDAARAREAVDMNARSRFGATSWEPDYDKWMDRLQKIRKSTVPKDQRKRAHHLERAQEAIKTKPPLTHHHNEVPYAFLHIRLHDTTNADGDRILVVDEIQSDWHQKGRTESGYYEGIQSIDSMLESATERQKIAVEQGLSSELGRMLYHELHAYNNASHVKPYPDALFKNNWSTLALRRILQIAAREKYNKIAWTPANIQIDRNGTRPAGLFQKIYESEAKSFFKKMGKAHGAGRIVEFSNETQMTKDDGELAYDDNNVTYYLADRDTGEELGGPYESEEEAWDYIHEVVPHETTAVATADAVRGEQQLIDFAGLSRMEPERPGANRREPAPAGYPWVVTVRADFDTIRDATGRDVEDFLEDKIEGVDYLRVDEDAQEVIFSRTELFQEEEPTAWELRDRAENDGPGVTLSVNDEVVEGELFESEDDAREHYYENYEPYVDRREKEIIEGGTPAELHTATLNEKMWDAYKGTFRRYSVGNPLGTRLPPTTAAQGRQAQDNFVRARTYGMVDKYLHSDKPKWWLGNTSMVDLRIKLQDKMLPIGMMQDAILKNGGVIDDNFNTYMVEQLSHGKTVNEIRENEDRLYLPLLRELKRIPNISLADFEDFLVARHAESRNRVIRSRWTPEVARQKQGQPPAGIETSDANALLAKFQREGKTPELTRLSDMAYAIIESTNQIRLANGLIDPSMLNQSWEYYVPLRGETVDESDVGPDFMGLRHATKAERALGPRTGKKGGIRGKEDKSATGRRTASSDTLAHIFQQNEEAVVRANRNQVIKSFADMVRSNESMLGDTAWILGAYPTQVTTNKTTHMLELKPNMVATQTPDVVAFKEIDPRTGKVKEVHIQTRDVRLAKALNGLSSPDSNGMLVTFLGKMNRWLANVNTSWNPEFMISNMLKDIQTAGIVAYQYDVEGLSGRMIKSVPTAVRGIHHVLRAQTSPTTGDAKWFNKNQKPLGPEAQEYANAFKRLEKLGGTTEFLGLKDLNTTLEKIETQLKNVDTKGQAAYRNSKSFMKQLGELVGDYNKVAENAIRLTAFHELTKGPNPITSDMKAAMVAKNLTVNFNKGGTSKAFANSMYLFYNASLQGTWVLMNAMKSKRVQKIAGGIVVAGMVQDTVNSILGFDDDDDGMKDYDEIDDWVKEHNIIFTLPDGLRLQIPMPYGFNSFFNMGRAMSALARGAPNATPAKTAESIVLSFADSFNPLGGSNNLVNWVAPTVLDPWIDLYANRDFAGRPIKPERVKSGSRPVEPDSQLFWNSTYPPFVGVADFLNRLTGGNEFRPGKIDWSPNQIEHLFDYALGATGTFVTRTYSTAVTEPLKVLQGDFENVDLNSVVLLRKLIGSTGNIQDRRQFYTNAEDVLLAQKEYEGFLKAGDIENATATREKYGKQLQISGFIKSIDGNLSKLRQRLKTIRANPHISDTVRETLEKQIKDQQDMYIDQANRMYNQIVRDGS